MTTTRSTQLALLLRDPRQLVWFLQRRSWRKIAQKMERSFSGDIFTPVPDSLTDILVPSLGWITDQADIFATGKRLLYGHLWVSQPTDSDWFTEPLSHYKFLDQFGPNIPYTYPKGTDIKNLWELHRLQHLPVYARAYRMSSDTKYLDLLIADLVEWQKINTAFQGPAWMIAMEVALRAVSLILTASIAQNKRVTEIVAQLLPAHGEFIWNNQERFGIIGNHYLTNLVGLVWIGAALRESPIGLRWLHHGTKQLRKEIRRQFPGEGLNFEQSTAYHRFMLELCAATELLAQGHFSRSIVKSLNKTHSLSLKDTLPVIGDDDGGSAFPVATGWTAFTTDLLRRLAQAEASTTSADTFIRVEAGELTCIMVCTPNAQKTHLSHQHDDLGSVQLFSQNHPIIVDPGTGTYTGDAHLRHVFRSRRYHNLPTPHNQNTPEPHDPFGPIDRGTAKRLMNSLEVRHRGDHFTRSITTNSSCVILHDHVSAPGITNFLLHPSQVPRLHNSDTVIIDNSLVVSCENAQLSIADSQYSPQYGRILATKVLTVAYQSDYRITFRKP